MNLALSIFIVIGAWAIGNIIITQIRRWTQKKKQGIHIAFLLSVSRVIWTIIAIALISGMFPSAKEVTKALLTSSGLIVAVLGFSAQQVLADVISGLMLSWTKPFDIGEKIVIQDLNISGIVESMSIRHTIVRTYHNSRLLIPNSVINKSVVENSNYNGCFVGSYLEIPIDYDSDIEKAKNIIENAVENHPLVYRLPDVEKKTSVLIKDFSEIGIILKCTIRTKDLDDNFRVCSELREEIKKQFDQENIKLYYKRIQINK